MADVKKLAEELVNLTVKEVNELATILSMALNPLLLPLQSLHPLPAQAKPLSQRSRRST